MNNYKTLLLLVFLVLINSGIYAQGCSDAGVCTIDSFKPALPDSAAGTRKNSLKLSLAFGRADHAIWVRTATIEYSRKFSEKCSADARLITTGQNGKNSKNSGFSDIYATASYAFAKKTVFTSGVKIPLTNANQQLAGLPLPMDYQPGLGTFDLIAGLGFEWQKVKMVLALQQPLTQNKNRFLAQDYPENTAFRAFQSTNRYRRSGDIMFRASYPVRLSENLSLTPGMLPIYHLQNDRFTNSAGREETITGSRGLTLNATVYLDYKLRTGSIARLSFGAPLITRKVRPDGLTRSFVAGLETHISF